MDPQTNALYDIDTFQQNLDPIKVNCNAFAIGKPPKIKNNTRKCIIMTTQRSENDSSDVSKKETDLLTPSSSFCRVKRDHGLKLGESNLAFSSPNMLLAPQLSHLVRTGSYVFSDNFSGVKLFSDASSVKSLASIGVGSTDGRKMFIRKVPHTPSELLSYIHPPTPPDELYENESYDLSDDDGGHFKPRRQHWSSKMQFVLACIGYSVGLANVWRFPYIMYKNGGGAFLLPYFVCLLFCGIPLLFTELTLGQFTGRGPIGAIGQCVPLLKGVGLSAVVVAFLMSSYYSVVIAYSIFYFFTSFRPDLPWTNCDSPRWNTPDCWNYDMFMKNLTRPNNPRTPAEEFFHNKVLKMSFGLEFPGGVRWDLVACLICAWILVYFAIWKSIKSSTKIRYFTASFPFVLIVILLGRAITLEGAEKGLQFFFRPHWPALKDANVWISAMGQTFNSFGVAFGSMVSLASYNKYSNNILHDTIAVSSVNFITSMLVGIFSFAIIGNISFEQGEAIGQVINDGPGMIFIVYPHALARMPAPQLWSVLFFFMLLCLGLNSQFAIVEVVVTSIQDGFPRWIRQNLVYHEVLVLLVCVAAFFFGLPAMIQGGIYFFQLIDHYVGSLLIVFVALSQVIAIGWIYGVNRLMRNIKEMTSKGPSIFFRFCWFFASPLLLIAIFVLAVFTYEPLTYQNGAYIYPNWAHALGIGTVSCTLFCIPAYAVFILSRTGGESLRQKIKCSIQPNIYECKLCLEHHCNHDNAESIHELSSINNNFTPIVLKSPPLRNNINSQVDKPSSSNVKGERK